MKLVVEIDGDIHLDNDVSESDKEKMYFISAYDVTVLRVANEEVLNEWESVIKKIKKSSLPSPLRRRVGDEVVQNTCDPRKIEVISADSRQVFRGMDIGTDKVSEEEQQRVPHRGLDLVDPDEEFTAGQRKVYTEQKIAEIQARGNIPVVV